jgi:hypothetical protein
VKKDRGKKRELGEKSPFMAISEFLGGNLLEQLPDLERLETEALYFEPEQAKPAARELLKRATEVLRHLGPVLMSRPDLLQDDAVKRFEMPVLIALSGSHRYYYKRVVNQLIGLKLGSETGVASSKRAKWKSEGETGAWATALVNIADELRRASLPEDDYVIRAFVLSIRTFDREDNPGATEEDKANVKEVNQTKIKIVNDAKRLKPFGPDTVKDWIDKVCLPGLCLFRPELRPARRGKRKKTDKERTDPRVRRKRDAIVARIRAMAAGSDKAHSWIQSM